MIELCLLAYSRDICSTLGALLPSVDQTFNIKVSALVGLWAEKNRDPPLKAFPESVLRLEELHCAETVFWFFPSVDTAGYIFVFLRLTLH